MTPAKSYEVSAISIHFVVKLNLSRLSVYFHNALSKWRHMTSNNVTFIDVIGALYYVALHQNRNAVFGQLTGVLFLSNK